MKNILLLYPPFCTPIVPPFSITNLYNFLKNNLSKNDYNIDVLDLNAKFHSLKFPEYKQYYQKINANYNPDEYNKLTNEFRLKSSKVYSSNNKLVRQNENPEYFDELFQKILEKKPDIVAISFVYSSQAFYGLSLIRKIKENGIKVAIGGPAVNDILRKEADSCLSNKVELLEYCLEKKPDYKNIDCSNAKDYSIYNFDEYFTPKPVIPLKSCSVCFHRKCAFCTHYNTKSHYFEFDLNGIKETIEKSKSKHFFFIDDMIHTKRLLDIAKILKPLNVTWTCQLRPTKDLTKDVLKTLYESGLKIIIWGVENANNRVLDLIQKGTNIEDIKEVLSNSHNIGIKNICYIIFGFPTETKDELLKTIDFLKDNSDNIDFILTSIFGLQEGSEIYNNPKKYAITQIHETKRTILPPKISYKVSRGLTNEEAIKLRRKYSKTINGLNKYPQSMNIFREHMLCLIKTNNQIAKYLNTKK